MPKRGKRFCRLLQSRGLIFVRVRKPMFPDLPGAVARTGSVLTNEGLEELESMGHDHGWQWGRYVEGDP